MISTQLNSVRSTTVVLILALIGAIGCKAEVASRNTLVTPDFTDTTQPMSSAGDVPFDSFQMGELHSEHSFELFSFEGRGGSEITVELPADEVSPALVPSVFVIGPIDDGSFPELGHLLVDEENTGISVKLPEDGQYLIAIGAQEGNGAFKVALWCESDTCAMPETTGPQGTLR